LDLCSGGTLPTVMDGVTADELRAVWDGSSTGYFSAWPLWMTDSTRQAFSQLWGEPAAHVSIAEREQLLDAAWRQLPSWALLPFEELQPRWKVLTIDGQSPVRKDFDPAKYALVVRFGLSGDSAGGSALALPPTNRDSSKLTTVLLSGTSGLVREIAYQMEVLGITYPARDIGGWLREADIFHTSHETSFDPACPPPNPLKNRFYCSSPRYMGLFDDVGLDVVELTGNHIMDNGAASMLYTLALYRDHGISYYGGGENLDEARKPLLVEHNGNKIAFLGCIFAEPPQPLAGRDVPGANPCDWNLLAEQVEGLLQQGYLPIVTLQYKEGYSPIVMPWQSIDFRRAADAGAVIVSGSQSHVPLQMEFRGGAFIHYGLGNLFFGQMANHPPGPGLPLQPAERYEFLDRHVFYDGHHISTELLTAMLEDYARPRPMTAEERSAILQAYFGYSGWLPLVPTPLRNSPPRCIRCWILCPCRHIPPSPGSPQRPDGFAPAGLMRHGQRETAVHLKGLSHDHARRRRAQERDHAGNVFGAHESARWHSVYESPENRLLAARRSEMTKRIRCDNARRNGVHVNVLANEFNSQVTGKRLERGLAGAYRDVVRKHACRSCACQAHDRTPASCLHERSSSLRREQQGPGIDVHGPVPALGLLLHGGPVVAGRRAVYQHVRSPPLVGNFIKQPI